MWINPKEMSEIMYNLCLEEDKEEYWSLITGSIDAYYYCQNIKDRPEIRKHITKSDYAYYYCKNIKDRPEIRKFIKD